MSAAEAVTPQFPPLEFTANNLSDVIGLAQAGNYLVMYTGNDGRFFHRGCHPDVNTSDWLSTHRVIYLDVSSQPGLLDDGEWNYYLDNAGIPQCTCPLKTVVAESKNVPHQEQINLGY